MLQLEGNATRDSHKQERHDDAGLDEQSRMMLEGRAAWRSLMSCCAGAARRKKQGGFGTTGAAPSGR